MKAVGPREKQPDEILPAGRWNIDFTPDLAIGETISAASVLVYDESGADVTSALTSGAAVINGNLVSIAYKGGEDGYTYYAEHTIVTSVGVTAQTELLIQVAEIPSNRVVTP